MTPEKALQRIQHLLALAAPGSGATEEEARTAATQAVRLMVEHNLPPGGSGTATTSAPLTELSLRLHIQALEGLLGERHHQHVEELRRKDSAWRWTVQETKYTERRAAKRQVRKGAALAARKEREALAKKGGYARAKALTPARKREIACAAVEARWARWRASKPPV